MKHYRVLLIAAAITSLFGFASIAKPAHAACAVTTILPGSGTIRFTFLGGHDYDEVYGPPYNYTSNVGIYPHDTAINIPSGPAPITIIDLSVDCVVPSVPVTSFDPGDDRLDPRPGDRLAVYCNPAEGDEPADIDVLGLIDNKGVELINPYVQDVANQWQSFPDGMGGSVSIGGQGSTIVVQWFNSSVGATGAGDFAKTVTCAG